MQKPILRRLFCLRNIHNRPIHQREATSKIGTVEDKTPKLTRIQRRLYINISGGFMALSILMIMVLEF
jgi:hypothetical protein